MAKKSAMMRNDSTPRMHSQEPQRFWQFRAEAGAESAELLLYGLISNTTWWGDEVSPALFAQELAAMGDVRNITVRIYSYGGDPFAALAIRNLLDSHPADITVRIDGAAASAATLIAPLRAKIVMPSNSAILIHQVRSAGYFALSAEEMHRFAEAIEGMNENAISIYEERTGMSREDIAALMAEDRWMYAAEAVEKGFANQLEQSSMAACVCGDQLMVNGVGLELARFNGLAAESIVTEDEAPSAGAGTAAAEHAGDGAQVTDAGTATVVMVGMPEAEYAAAIAAARNEGVQEERARQVSLNELAVNEETARIVSEARESGMSAEQCSMEIFRAMKKSAQGAVFLAARELDAQQSGANGVVAGFVPDGNNAQAAQTEHRIGMMLSGVSK